MLTQPAPRIRPLHEGRGQKPGAPTVESLIRDTSAVLERIGVSMAPSKVIRLCRDYINIVANKDIAFVDYLANAVTLNASQRRAFDEEYYRLTHADPTGETAVRNVMRGGDAG